MQITEFQINLILEFPAPCAEYLACVVNVYVIWQEVVSNVEHLAIQPQCVALFNICFKFTLQTALIMRGTFLQDDHYRGDTRCCVANDFD